MGIDGLAKMQIVPPQGTYIFTFQSGDVYKDALNCEEAWSKQHIDGAGIFISLSDIESNYFWDMGNITQAFRRGFLEPIKLLLAHTFNPKKEGKLLQNRGAAPFIKVEPWSRVGKNDATFSLVNFNKGKFDHLVRVLGKELKSYGGPAYLTFGHEMNSDWYPWGTANPKEYIDAYNRFCSIIAEEAPNATFVWNPDLKGTRATMDFYPGRIDQSELTGHNLSASVLWIALRTEKYIDANGIIRPHFTGARSDFRLSSVPAADTEAAFQLLQSRNYVKAVLVDAYDWSGNVTFRDLFVPGITALDQQINGSADPQDRIPLGIGEIGTAAKNKAAFLTDMVNTLATYVDNQGNPIIKLVMYFNIDKEHDWRIFETADRQALAAAMQTHASIFRENIVTRRGELSDRRTGKRSVTPEICLSIDRQRFFSRNELKRFKKIEKITTEKVALTRNADHFYTPTGTTNKARVAEGKAFIELANYQRENTDGHIQYLRALEILGMYPAALGTSSIDTLWKLPDFAARTTKYNSTIKLLQAAYEKNPSFDLPEDFSMKGASARRVAERRRVFQYFDIFLDGADILAQISPKSSLVICERIIGSFEQQINTPAPISGIWPAIKRTLFPRNLVVRNPAPRQGELYSRSFQNGHAIYQASISGYEARTRMLMGWNYQKLGGENELRADRLYALVIDWSERELGHLSIGNFTLANSIYLHTQKDTKRTNVRYIGARAKLGKAELKESWASANDRLVLVNDVLSWKEVGKRSGPMDLGIRALIGAIEICLPDNELLFSSLPWEDIDTYFDLKETLHLERVDLTAAPNKLELITKSLFANQLSLPPDLRISLDDLKTDPSKQVNRILNK